MEIKKAYQYLRNALANLYGKGEANSVTSILFEDAFGITNPEKIGDLTNVQSHQFLKYAERLLHREPIQYILEQADFFGLKLRTTPAVLIPRQETEELVAWIIETYKKKKDLRILDIGTGSGCIAISLKKHLPNAEVWAVDVSKEAMIIARENSHFVGVDILFQKVDVLDESQWAELPDFDVIVSNPPYISTKEKHLMPDWVLDYEPHLALFSEKDPLLFYKTIGHFALKKGKKNKTVFFELNEFNASEVKAVLFEKGFTEVQIREDLNGKDRMLMAMKE